MSCFLQYNNLQHREKDSSFSNEDPCTKADFASSRPTERSFLLVQRLTCTLRVDAQVDASRRWKKLLNSSRDENLKARTVTGRGEERPVCDPMVDLNCERERAREEG